MDVSRAVLDNLMGRDRNKLMDEITQRDHYSNPDVCKSFLVCFCFNTLFPNTTYDQGPCQKRHDTYLKNMFDSDPNRAQYQREYIKQCIHWIQRRLQQVQKKTKQNQSVIDNKSNFPADRPKQVLDRILAIQEDIQRLISQSQKYGQEGKIDDCARCLEQVQKLRDRRREIQLMGVDANSAQKQQKICLICGAIQTINDTEKRIQTHLQGKIHQGFLKLRHQVETLKIRLQVLNKMNPTSDKKQKQDQQKRREQREKQRERQRQRQKQRQRQRQKERERERQKQNDRKREQNERKSKQMASQNNNKPVESRQNNDRQPRQRSDSPSRRRRRSRSRQRRDGEKNRDRRRDSRDRRSRSRDHKQRKHHRDSRERENKQRNHKQKDHKKKSKKNRSRSKQRDERKERDDREVY